MRNRKEIIEKIFEKQGNEGFWQVLSEKNKYYPAYMHYVPNYRATLWTLILLADLELNKEDERIKKQLEEIQNHFFDPKYGIFTLKEDHFPIPCLNGNMIYLDCYFNTKPGAKTMKALDFFYKYQRFDDGSYVGDKNKFCSNTSCYGKHSCYWGVVKLLKGISFVPKESRTEEINDLLERCIHFVLLHNVCFSSHKPNKIMIKKIDFLTFPNMYKSDFLEILWLMKREGVSSNCLKKALALLKSKQQEDGSWLLEKKVHNMATSIGEVGESNQFITHRAREVLDQFNFNSDKI